MSDLAAVFRELRGILLEHAAGLDVKRDDGSEISIDTRFVRKNGKPLFFGAVRIVKSRVSFHLMPVYVSPALLDGISPALKARMQGKSCFDFKAVDGALFGELASLTKAGYRSYQRQGFVP